MGLIYCSSTVLLFCDINWQTGPVRLRAIKWAGVFVILSSTDSCSLICLFALTQRFACNFSVNSLIYFNVTHYFRVSHIIIKILYFFLFLFTFFYFVIFLFISFYEFHISFYGLAVYFYFSYFFLTSGMISIIF